MDTTHHQPTWLVYWRGQVIATATTLGGANLAIRTHQEDLSEATSPDGSRRRGHQGQADGYSAVRR